MTTSPIAVKFPEKRSPEGQPTLTHDDVAAINRRLRYLNDHFGNLRVHQAMFRIPWPLAKSHYEQYRKEAVNKWLAIMEKKGWDLKSKVHVKGIRPAYGLYGPGQETIPLLDQRSVSVLAAFQLKNNAPKKIEVLVSEESFEDQTRRHGGLVVGEDGAWQ